MPEISDFLKDLLIARGIQTPEETEIFLNPDYERDIHDPFLLTGMEKAVARILSAIEKKEKIVLFSDFDADGIPAAVVMHDTLLKLGHTNFSVVIPHRNTEGFGLNDGVVARAIEDKTNLLVTLDCGMGDAKYIEILQAGGVDVIVTDHHLPNHDVPEAFAIVNPNQAGDTYPNKYLCGAGVAFKIAQAIFYKLNQNQSPTSNFQPPTPISKGWEKWLLDMVAIATLSDMVPLQGENRTLAYYGLLVLRKSPRIGIRTLCQHLRLFQKNITEDDVVFSITPRINAASRMDEPESAFELLSTKSEARAEVLATHLENINKERKVAVAVMAKEVKQKLKDRAEGPVIVVGNPHWRPGLLGLVATNVVESYSCSAFVWGRGDAKVIKGSCRSNGSVDVLALMNEAKDLFLEFGGHKKSGGFSITVPNLALLPDALSKAYERIHGTDKTSDDVVSGPILTLDDISSGTFSDIQRLSPCGMGNEKPVFVFENVSVSKAETFGKEKGHVRLTFARDAGTMVNAIEFFSDESVKNISAGDTITLHATLERDTFTRGQPIRLRIVDVIQTELVT
ncbi:MAG: single-stranded-DNA-specific exonuclease RecJ [Patescibacteria group bacterium]